MTPEQFQAQLAAQGITLTAAQMAQFHQYFELLVTANEKMNLTAITAEGDVYLKHFFDSLTLAQAVPELAAQTLTMMDVGSGAGLPGIPVKIAFPQTKLTILDSLQKRINFLNDVVGALNFTDVALIHGRAEDAGNKRSPQREAFDLVTARAVAPLNVLAELTLPLVKVGGVFVAMKGSAAPAEIETGAYAVAQLGGVLEKDLALSLPADAGERHLLVYRKKRHTPKRYPRRAGVPHAEPLVQQS
ncbi:16S rRNA (guanine(527)-N(7))-methyltransferase RsmG [Schleiferilactobacillus shenzhenensis]|uniref:Ribosomal RNA small subunit methyltransferase G n=1 Tax=Schleiferilactobacillus shenzhenensis LY-73 TaxID=1231336 RepID=U4TII4_9LACO|nr:16S rRNA (guanine(527)-N(7))-methyltransferase RsmG [Schleiferilactobacillus shenzhenensis]ERL64621.1 RsmG [Schleiferilactobacillus shenzhenensis LY-73]